MIARSAQCLVNNVIVNITYIDALNVATHVKPQTIARNINALRSDLYTPGNWKELRRWHWQFRFQTIACSVLLYRLDGDSHG